MTYEMQLTKKKAFRIIIPPWNIIFHNPTVLRHRLGLIIVESPQVDEAKKPEDVCKHTQKRIPPRLVTTRFTSLRECQSIL